MGAKEKFTIGKVAKAVGVNIQTLRYYERIGILIPVGRKDSGYRIYDEIAVKTIRFIKHAQHLGFSLDEIEALLKLKLDKRAKCETVAHKARSHLNSVQEKIKKLQAIEGTLEDLIGRCNERKMESECPFLNCLDSEPFPEKRD